MTEHTGVTHFWDSTKLGFAVCGAHGPNTALTDKTAEVTCQFCRARHEFFARQHAELAEDTVTVIITMPRKHARELAFDECVGNSVFLGSPHGDGLRFEIESIDGEPFEYGSKHRARWEGRQ